MATNTTTSQSPPEWCEDLYSPPKDGEPAPVWTVYSDWTQTTAERTATFSNFKQLPCELRRMIWRWAMVGSGEESLHYSFLVSNYTDCEGHWWRAGELVRLFPWTTVPGIYMDSTALVSLRGLKFPALLGTCVESRREVLELWRERVGSDQTPQHSPEEQEDHRRVKTGVLQVLDEAISCLIGKGQK